MSNKSGWQGPLRITVIFAIMVTISPAAAQFGGGDGTPDNPYLIRTPEHLNNVRDYLDANFLQTTDISLSGEWSEGNGWNPIGDVDNRFRGNYNGSGNRIISLRIDSEGNHIGLFGYVMNGRIEKVNLIDVDVQGSEFVGGIAGIVAESVIEECSVIGNVTGGLQVGGITGFSSSESSLSKCFVDGSVIGLEELSFVGGVTGVNFDESLIINSYSHANVRGNSQMIGGLIGWNFMGIVINSYSMGVVSATAFDPTQVGGLVGDDAVGAGTFTNSYWDMEASGRNLSAAGYGRNTEQMTYRYADNTYQDWDFADIWVADDEYRYNGGYPYLSFQEFIEIDKPDIVITIEEQEGVSYVVITWDQVDNANSYRIFASYDPYTANWGDPIETIAGDETTYSEPLEARGKKFYRVTSSILGP